MKLYASDGTLILLALIYLPLIVWMLKKLWAKLPGSIAIRAMFTLGLMMIALPLPLTDVLLTSHKMNELCASAGVVVKRAVKVAGYLTNLGNAEPLDRP